MSRSLAALALLVAADASAGEVARRALVVGANDGGPGFETLRYAEQDATRIAAVLTSLGGFEPGAVTVLHAPTPAGVRDAIAAIGGEVGGPEAMFLFYYSGHADGAGLHLGGEILDYGDLKASIRAVPADVHLGILDACRSGAITRVKGAHVEAPFLLEEGLAAEGEAWIAASAAHEDAQESDWLQGSFFTHYLVSGLRGAADTGDGWVSLQEAYSYAYDRTVARTTGTSGGTQHPAYDFQLQGNGDLKITEVRRATAHVTFPVTGAGEIAILRQPESQPVAEVAKVEGRAVTLALEPGTYLVRQRADGEVREVRLHLTEGASLVVDRWGDPKAPEVASSKGADDDYWTFRVPKIDGLEDLPKLELPRLDLARKPAIAGVASALLPGAGQAYEGRWGHAALFFSAFSVLNAGSWGWAVLDRPEQTGAMSGPNPGTLLGLGLYGWTISDAIWGAQRREDLRPKRGTTVALETVWARDLGSPHASGLAVDVVLVPGLSIGVDRTGYLTRRGVEPHEGELRTGVRMMAAYEGTRVRPAVFGAVGAAIATVAVDDDHSTTDGRLVVAGGGNLRFYATPRYFLQLESRLEWDTRAIHWVNGGAFGVHVGGDHPRRPLQERPAESR